MMHDCGYTNQELDPHSPSLRVEEDGILFTVKLIHLINNHNNKQNIKSERKT